MRVGLNIALVTTALLVTTSAHAVDLPKVGDTKPTLDVTETSVVAQRFNAREGENPNDQGYGQWLNRLNALFSYKTISVGIRLDSAYYWLRPEDRDYPTVQQKNNAITDGSTRFHDSIYPAKAWVTYKSGALEATAGDSYVQFGRGLVLSMRKVDELGLDTTLFGGKVVLQSDPFQAIVIAGLANPARIDEPSGRSLLLPKPVPVGLPGANAGPQPLLGSDRIVGAQIQAGRGLPVVLATHGVIVTKCAPYSYDANGRVNDSFFDAPIGTCNQGDVDIWLGKLEGNKAGPILASSETINLGQSLEIPSLWGHGNLYVEAAVQKHDPDATNKLEDQGNAVYGSLTSTGGPISNTLEVKSYRNYFPLSGSVDIGRASAFANVAYSAPPTAEVVTQDAMFGSFNACVTGGRDRFDYRLTDDLLVYGALGYFITRSETPGGKCDRMGKSTSDDPSTSTNTVYDVSTGGQWTFDGARSIAFLTLTHRDDRLENGDPYYFEWAVQYTITKYIGGPYSLELTGRNRWRRQEDENLRRGGDGAAWWAEGEDYLALKVAPKWVFSSGWEYTNRIGLPDNYFNGSILYRFTSQSNIRAIVGQNRGGLKCVSGICRNFPAFNGARAELTLRF